MVDMHAFLGRVLVVFICYYGVQRVLRYHPVHRPSYRQWLELSPWTHHLRLPLGPDRLLPLPAAFFIGNLMYIYRETITPFARKYGLHFGLIVVSLRLVEQLAGGASWPHIIDAGNLVLWCLLMVGLILVGISRTSPKRLPIDLSYGIYIYHFPIYVAITETYGISGPRVIALCLAGTIVVATLSWFFVEQPFLKMKNKGRLSWRRLRAQPEA